MVSANIRSEYHDSIQDCEADQVWIHYSVIHLCADRLAAECCGTAAHCSVMCRKCVKKMYDADTWQYVRRCLRDDDALYECNFLLEYPHIVRMMPAELHTRSD